MQPFVQLFAAAVNRSQLIKRWREPISGTWLRGGVSDRADGFPGTVTADGSSNSSGNGCIVSRSLKKHSLHVHCTYVMFFISYWSYITCI